MTRWAIVDAGPLIALLDRREVRHIWATERFRELEAPLLVCEPVLTEVLFVTQHHPAARDEVMQMLQSEALRIAFSLAREVEAVRRLMAKYSDVPMSLADACLVRMAELYAGYSICTLDADFRVYRKHGREQIPVIMPPS